MSTESAYTPRRKLYEHDGKVDLKAFDREGLQDWFVEQGEKKFRGHQVFKWIWQRSVWLRICQSGYGAVYEQDR